MGINFCKFDQKKVTNREGSFNNIFLFQLFLYRSKVNSKYFVPSKIVSKYNKTSVDKQSGKRLEITAQNEIKEMNSTG